MGILNEIEIFKHFFGSQVNKGTLKTKRIFDFFLSVFAVVTIIWTWGYISLLRSDEYAFASNFLKGNQRVIEYLGPIKSTRPGFTKFKTSYGSGMWTSRFQVVLEGDKHGVAYLQMTNSTNNWVINEASMVMEDGSTIALIP